jgi:uncharacterized protein YggE
MRMATLFVLFAASAATASAQEAGGQIYREGGNQAYGRTAPGVPPALSGDTLLYEHKDYTAVPFLEAYVLMNVAPDAFVAVFAAAQEAKTADESNAKVDAQISAFATPLGLRREDVFVDFIAQVPVYDYSVQGRTAREALTGFQTRKTVAVRYTDRTLFDRLVATAARAGIYDLVKVDYVVSDTGAVRQRLFDEASKVIERKAANYTKLLASRIFARAVAEERYASYAPGELYKTYTAYEAGSVEASGSATRVVERRKTSTSYYDPLRGGAFDAVVNAAGLEPAVQYTLFLKVKCEVTTGM